MPKDLEIKTSAKKVSNAKTKSQDEEKEKLKKQKAEADKKAKEKQKEEVKKAEEESGEGIINDETIALAKKLAKKAVNSKPVQSKKGIIIALLVGLLLGFLLSSLLGGRLFKRNDNEVVDNETISENIVSHTEADFKEAILGAPIEHQDLIVMEQPLEVETTITKSGLANLSIFSKVKNINYAGSGIYTVDMSHIDKDHIDVDMDKKLVTIKIPHTVLFETVLDVDNIKFEDTEKGLLSFGELKLTSEEVNTVEKAVKKSMEDRLKTEDLFKEADEFATLKTWQIFQPLVTAVSPEYVVEMVFE